MFRISLLTFCNLFILEGSAVAIDLSVFSTLSNEKKRSPTLLLACRDFITLNTAIIQYKQNYYLMIQR